MDHTRHQARLRSLNKELLLNNCDAAIISQKENITYFTGLETLHPTERESFLLITPKQTVLYHTPFMNPPKTNPHLKCIPMSSNHPFQTILTTYLAQTSILGIEKNNLSVSEKEKLETILPHTSCVGIDAIPMKLRQIKDTSEIKYIKKAISITKNTLKWVQIFTASKQAQGMTEKTLKQQIENHLLELESDGLAFPTIVAFGNHTAYPHHIATNRRLTPNTAVLVDLGARVNGYCADMTRTWFIGTPTPLFNRLEKIVILAHHHAIKQVKNYTNTLTAKQIDDTARQIIDKAHLAEYFIHSTGHGLGLEAHEPPSISTANQDRLKPNMVITIEPGIYLPGKLGYRHEDTVII